jgi:hypothetical protein
MSKFLVLYQSEAAAVPGAPSVAEMFANTPPEQLEAAMAMWTAWYEKCGSAIVDGGAPLHNPTSVTTGGAVSKPSTVTGYTVLEAESMSDAVEMAKSHPHLFMPGATVELLEFVAMPGM